MKLTKREVVAILLVIVIAVVGTWFYQILTAHYQMNESAKTRQCYCSEFEYNVGPYQELIYNCLKEGLAFSVNSANSTNKIAVYRVNEFLTTVKQANLESLVLFRCLCVFKKVEVPPD